jgi:thiol-disulfide isomerase/thioredoxin
MAFNPKRYFSDYFKKKKPLSIFFDALFVILILLLLIPATRKETAAMLIRWTSFPASNLDSEEQYAISESSNNWILTNLNGEQITFRELNAKPVFLNVWATWCPPCIAELPGIEDLYDQYGDDVSFVLVSNEDPEIVKAFARRKGYESLPFFYAKYAPQDFQSQSIPATFVIDGQGRVLLEKKGAARWNSARTRKLLDDLIN